MGDLLDPEVWWDQVEQRLNDGDAARYLLSIAIVGGFGIAFASEIGIRVFNTDWHAVAGYNAQPMRGWLPFGTLWGVLTMLPIVQGLIGACLLPLYSRPRQWLRSIGVAIVGAVPIYLAGLTLVLLPGILLVAVAFLISCAWWGSGCRRLLAVPASESADFVGASLIFTSAFLFLASTWLVW